MAYSSIYNGVIFIEGYEPSARTLGDIEYVKGHTFNSQSKTLDCVKAQLSEKALAIGGNAVINFRYGQKTSGWFKSILFSLDDDINWYGSGTVAIIPDDLRNKILEKIK